MSLRIRLFLLLSALVALLVVAQAWWVRSLAEDLSAEMGEVVLSVGSSVATVVGGGDFVLTERRVIQDEEGAHQVSIIRRVHTTSRSSGLQGRSLAEVNEEDGEAGRAGTTEEIPSQPAHENHFRFEVRVDSKGEGGGEDPVWIRESEQEMTVLLLRQGGEDEAASLLVQGAGLDSDIPIPQGGLSNRVDRFARRLQLGSFALLGIGLLLAAAVAHRVSAPLRQLSSAARRVGEGELGVQAPVPADPEIGLAVRSFNRMSTELEQLDRASKSMQARRHLAELGEVGRGLAHSLRNPLNALGLTVDELAARASHGGDDGEGAEEEAGALALSARRQIRRIDNSIRSFLLLAAEGVGAGTMTESVDLARMVDDVVLEAIQDGRGKVRVRVEESEESEPLRVRAVAAELRAVIQALIVNAVEASPPGATVQVRLSKGVAPRAGAGRDEGPGRKRVEVCDRGPGLAPQVRARLFQPHLTTKSEGSGMGLFLSHRIVTERYDGSLELNERAEGGTCALLEVADRQPPLDPSPEVPGEEG